MTHDDMVRIIRRLGPMLPLRITSEPDLRMLLHWIDAMTQKPLNSNESREHLRRRLQSSLVALLEACGEGVVPKIGGESHDGN